jgi:hypothetical protein
MPSKRFNENWDIEDPNAEIPHLPGHMIQSEELAEQGKFDLGLKRGSQSEAVHIENTPKA